MGRQTMRGEVDIAALLLVWTYFSESLMRLQVKCGGGREQMTLACTAMMTLSYD